ncbi:MAG TPA: HAD-IIIA family hydrolase [Phycisphaerae bacterium]|nr:HAD-IIIA family hydrolase [Phycisphaerae bacterium]
MPQPSAKKLILFPNSPTLLSDVPLFSQDSLLMAERAVFLDRDNTIIDNDGYLGDPAKVKLLPGAATALSAIRALDYRLIVVSNQSGVARGMFDENAVEAVNQEMCRQLRDQAGAHIDASYYCPYHPEAPIAEYKLDHDWRKPKPGMLKQAAADFGLDLSQCWTIGDQPRDIAAGAAAGTRTILLRDPDHKSTDADPPSLEVSPNFIVKTLADAARIIAREGKNHPSPAPTSVTRVADSPTQTLPASAPATGPVRNEPATTPAQPLVSNAATPAEAAQAAPPAIDENTLVEKLAQRLSKLQSTPAAPPYSRLEKSIDDLVAQLRMQNRAAEAPADFSGVKFAAIIVQILVFLALATGLFDALSAKATWKDWSEVAVAFTTLQRGIIWLLIAVILQIFAAILFRQTKK